MVTTVSCKILTCLIDSTLSWMMRRCTTQLGQNIYMKMVCLTVFPLCSFSYLHLSCTTQSSYPLLYVFSDYPPYNSSSKLNFHCVHLPSPPYHHNSNMSQESMSASHPSPWPWNCQDCKCEVPVQICQSNKNGNQGQSVIYHDTHLQSFYSARIQIQAPWQASVTSFVGHHPGHCHHPALQLHLVPVLVSSLWLQWQQFLLLAHW